MRSTSQVLTLVSILVLLAAACLAAPVTRTASGANPAAIQATVDQFRADLGGSNNGVGGSFTTGRRELNWDGVPDSFAAPNFLPNDFFNVNSPRGITYSTHTTFGDTSAFFVSADSNNPTATAVRFGNIDPSYTAILQTFSGERLFIARNNRVTEVNFFIPGTNIPATVGGFGAVFCDVDQAGPTFIKYYGVNGKLLTIVSAPTANNGLSFVGVSFNAGERVARVEIVSGTEILANGFVDGGAGVDIVAMDDFIYGEPRAAQYHASDFDGDGTADLSVFRPTTGNWFIFNSGSNTVSFAQWGGNGDVPISGDYDGDQKSDFAIFRPSTGEWFIFRSSDGNVIQAVWGVATDRPLSGDFDKDGKTDIAVYRPNGGLYCILKSSDGSPLLAQWGANGDIPIPGVGQ